MIPARDFAWFPLTNPGIVSIPLGFFLGWLGTCSPASTTPEAGRDGGPVADRCRRREGGLPLTSHTVRSPWGFLPSRAASPPTLPLLEVPLTSLPHLSGGSSQPPPVVRSALATQWRGHTLSKGSPPGDVWSSRARLKPFRHGRARRAGTRRGHSGKAWLCSSPPRALSLRPGSRSRWLTQQCCSAALLTGVTAPLPATECRT